MDLFVGAFSPMQPSCSFTNDAWKKFMNYATSSELFENLSIFVAQEIEIPGYKMTGRFKPIVSNDIEKQMNISMLENSCIANSGEKEELKFEDKNGPKMAETKHRIQIDIDRINHKFTKRRISSI